MNVVTQSFFFFFFFAFALDTNWLEEKQQSVHGEDNCGIQKEVFGQTLQSFFSCVIKRHDNNFTIFTLNISYPQNLKIKFEDMDFQEHSAANFSIVFHQSLNQFCIIFGLSIGQESLNHCNKAVPSFFGKFCVLYNLLYLWSNEDTSFNLCLSLFREEVSKLLKGCKLLRAAIRLKFMYNSGNNTSWDLLVAHT